MFPRAIDGEVLLLLLLGGHSYSYWGSLLLRLGDYFYSCWGLFLLLLGFTPTPPRGVTRILTRGYSYSCSGVTPTPTGGYCCS